MIRCETKVNTSIWLLSNLSVFHEQCREVFGFVCHTKKAIIIKKILSYFGGNVLVILSHWCAAFVKYNSVSYKNKLMIIGFYVVLYFCKVSNP